MVNKWYIYLIFNILRVNVPLPALVANNGTNPVFTHPGPLIWHPGTMVRQYIQVLENIKYHKKICNYTLCENRHPLLPKSLAQWISGVSYFCSLYFREKYKIWHATYFFIWFTIVQRSQPSTITNCNNSTYNMCE